MATTAAPPFSRRILLVDDDTITLDLLSHLFHHAGFATGKAASGEAALEALAQQAYDLALLDVNMPGMSGLELAKRLQADSQLPFMFLSSNNDIKLVRQAADYGAVGYLVKPFEHGQIVPAVEAALARADEIRQLRRTEANLTAALAAGRETSMAVGLLMARLQTDRNTAFEVMRDYARANRCKLNEVAQELLAAEEKIGVFKTMVANMRNKSA
ncbi:MAG TPA: response regulator [Noviherbaspirillum sp.]|uniref:ANTAR domain-containing response regulator n=1 Tax=Noviherbaspirillum sp. TaxID=1926288 RepID=UPI002D68411A|nr:response regulator [Noviherbaspirillum sp.]HYD96999.1 response regulator [Noviherbaspirillum sp.]